MIRRLIKGDIVPIKNFLEATRMFNNEEIDVAVEMMEECTGDAEQEDYISYVSVAGERVVGWICFGKTDFCEGVYDMYWICVDGEFQGEGVGKRLVLFMEKYLRERDDLRMMVAETSSQEKYRPTCRFYERCGFMLEAALRDFYSPGDDKLIYVKRY